jgi:dienelactone hydrolase
MMTAVARRSALSAPCKGFVLAAIVHAPPRPGGKFNHKFRSAADRVLLFDRIDVILAVPRAAPRIFAVELLAPRCWAIDAIGPDPQETSVPTLALDHSDGRTTTYRLAVPPRAGSWRVVLFSHGFNSSNADYDRLWDPWAGRGYLVIGPNHPDAGRRLTDPPVRPDELWQSRVADLVLPLRRHGPLDELAQAHGASLDWTGVGVAGHSLGAVVAQALAGATVVASGQPLARHEPAVAACFVLSPPGRVEGLVPLEAWATVSVPCLLQTGDADVLPGLVDDWHQRLAGFTGRPNWWTIIAHAVDHTFHGLICHVVADAKADVPALEETARLTGDFLDAYVRGDVRALDRLKARSQLGDDGVLSFAAA